MEEIVVEKRIVLEKEVIYSMVFSGNMTGIRLRDSDGVNLLQFLPMQAEEILCLIRRMARGKITAVSFSEIISDTLWGCFEKT